jgi:PTH1 family peptidyl-tRNA hydrolase
MKLIIGLGNPGEEYVNTRHNAGFLCIDFLQRAFDFEPFTLDKKMSARIASGVIGGQKILLVKPETFMNNSGGAVQALLHFYKLSPADIAVIHDDLDIAPAAYKTTVSSRAAGHNGVQDIITQLGTQDFFRLRLGIGRPADVTGTCMPSHDFVLKNFSAEESKNLSLLFPQIKEEVLHFIEEKQTK